MRNTFKIHWEQFQTKIEIALNFMYEIPLKINRTKKKFTKKLNSPSVLQKNPFKKYSEQKKINPEIWSQKYPLGSSSWRPFLKKVTAVV